MQVLTQDFHALMVRFIILSPCSTFIHFHIYQSMSLLNLSNELLLEIISYLEGACTSISRCSRHLHEVTEPVLYGSVSLSRPISYTRFFRTIVRRPCLVGYAQHFRLTGKWIVSQAMQQTYPTQN